MNRRRFLGACVAGLSILAGCQRSGPPDDPSPTDSPTAAPGRELENGSFEDGLRGWTVGRDLPADPNDPDRKVASDADITAHAASHGNQAVEFFLDGSADDGTIWVAQEIDLEGVDTLAVDAYSAKESFNTIAKLAVYAGPIPEKDLAEADFDTERATEDHEGWKTYEYEVTHDGSGLVAVGISVVWETGVRRQLDDVRLSAE